MNKKIKALIQLNRLIYNSAFENPTHGEINIVSNEVKFIKSGIFKSLKIFYKGKVFIKNQLPDGYGIRVTGRVIYIYNLLGRDLNDDLLFTFLGELEIIRAEARTFSGYRFVLSVTDENLYELIGKSKTNVEDDTILLFPRETSEKESDSITKSEVDDDSIKGLYTDKPIKNGYTGYYNYHPKEKIYMTGKKLTNESKPILDSKLSIKSPTIQKAIKKVSKKFIKTLERKGFKEVRKDIKTEQIAVKPVEEVVRKEVIKEITKEIKKDVIDIKGDKY